MFKGDNPHEHFTLLVKTKTETIVLHRAIEQEDGSRHYAWNLEISWATLKKAWVAVEKVIQEEGPSSVNPYHANPGYWRRKGLYLLALSKDLAELPGLFQNRERGRVVKFAKGVNSSYVALLSPLIKEPGDPTIEEGTYVAIDRYGLKGAFIVGLDSQGSHVFIRLSELTWLFGKAVEVAIDVLRHSDSMEERRSVQLLEDTLAEVGVPRGQFVPPVPQAQVE